MRTFRIALVAFVIASAVVGAATSQTCTVPGSHPSIEAAVDDLACSEIQLAAQFYDESVDIRRTLDVIGDPGGATLLAGQVVITGASTVVSVANVAIDTNCPVAFRVGGGAHVTGGAVHVTRSAGSTCPPMPGLLFADGFESGDTSGWTQSTP